MSPVTRPKLEQVSPGDLVQWAREGLIRLPSFQRSYQWDRTDVCRLFDSLAHEYPIGSLLVWRRPASADTVTIGPLTVSASETDFAYWVVDGHQRVTSLVGALTATDDTVDPRFRIYYDLDSGEFRSLARRQHPDPDWLPVPLTLDTAAANAWLRDRPHLTREQVALADSVVATIRDCRFPMYVVHGNDDRMLREIFERLNTHGRPLGRNEIAHARQAPSVADPPNTVRTLSDAVAGFGFGRLPDQLLMQSVLAIRNPVVDRDFRSEFRGDDDLHAALRTTREALGHVVDFLREEAGIPHNKLVPYALFLPVLARFAALFGPPEGRPAELLRRWVWRGAVLGVAPQGNTVGLRKNAKAVDTDPTASAERLIALLPAAKDLPWQPDLSHARINAALGKVNILGLLSRGPLPLPGTAGADGAAERRIDISSVLERESPPSLLAPIFDIPGPDGENIANRIVAPGAKSAQVHDALLESEGADTPGNDPEHRERFLAGHCLDDECIALLRAGDADAFLRRRTELVRTVIAEHVQNHALFGFSDGAPVSALFDDEPTPASSI